MPFTAATQETIPFIINKKDARVKGGANPGRLNVENPILIDIPFLGENP